MLTKLVQLRLEANPIRGIAPDIYFLKEQMRY